jgi:hypothetical protein
MVFPTFAGLSNVFLNQGSRLSALHAERADVAISIVLIGVFQTRNEDFVCRRP